MSRQFHCLVLAVTVLLAASMSKGAVAEQGLDAGQQPLVGESLFLGSAGDPRWESTTRSAREEERGHLLQHIHRSSGKWDSGHPRWKVLEALHGFDRYRAITGAEIDRFEGLYKHVPEKHKKVGVHLSTHVRSLMSTDPRVYDRLRQEL